MAPITKEAALAYHQLHGVPGKLSIIPSKPLETQNDLALAYTPGVAFPVLEIERDSDLAYEYTSRGNLVAVISNGTAILGLGDRGALASKPVMEGKAVLFKKFADIDSIDIEINSHDPETVIQVAAAISQSFGGINLEDIKSPECFIIEPRLQELLDIPVFHDDQHGTAIILGAGLVNALELVGKKLDTIKIVFSGAGAAAISCARLLVKLGVPKMNMHLCDSKGLITKGRKGGLSREKDEFAQEGSESTLSGCLEGADVFIGLSIANIVTPDMLSRMRADPILFAMANPDPEVPYEIARACRPDAIVATGRSDYPNQVNNVLGFPFIFRGALDVRARRINDEMKMAASYALAALAKERVPAKVLNAYGGTHLEFGREYIVPKPFDKRVCLWEAPAVVEAAMKSGVARVDLELENYRKSLAQRLHID
jgi:malate dehydrogenase (oxaloacetate-decarboxylating)(NADP+)